MKIIFNPSKKKVAVKSRVSEYFNSTELKVGVNELSDLKFEQLKDHPTYKYYLEIGVIEEIKPTTTTKKSTTKLNGE